jgi:uncharacterized protein YoaH (UPF0181 family)
MGLTVSQWQDFNAGLDSKQQRIMAGMKAGEAVESIAKDLGLKTNQVVSEWSQIYLAAQEIRSS